MGYLTDLKNLGKEEEKKKEENIIFSTEEETILRLYAPTEFIQNGEKSFRLRTKVLSGQNINKFYTLFFRAKYKDGLNPTLKQLSLALLSEETNKAETAEEVIQIFLENSDKIGRATIKCKFTAPKTFTTKDGRELVSQYITGINDVTFYVSKEQEEKQQW